jgi:hypothetical protein
MSSNFIEKIFPNPAFGISGNIGSWASFANHDTDGIDRWWLLWYKGKYKEWGSLEISTKRLPLPKSL